MATAERYRGERVLVTGAEGFVGSWLAERLLDGGATVVALRRDVDPESRFAREGIADRCTIAMADLTSYESIVRVVAEHEVGHVFHLGAQTLVGTATRSPLSTFESNVRGTYNLLEACRSAAVSGGEIERVVVASSDKAYGSHAELPYREGSPLAASYPYDVSKACADLLARAYASTYDLPVAVTRLANVYGGGDLHWSRVVPETARALARGERPVLRSDGTPERDYIYVEDAVDAYLAVGSSLDRPELRGRAWNAGSGRPVSVMDLVSRLIAVSGRDIEPDVQGRGTPHGEIDRQFLDSSAIHDELDWKPAWDLDRGLDATWRWYSERLG
jgi:CDP-glucose 4,6-dehydratase